MKATYEVYKGHWENDWVCMFKLDGRINKDERGTEGTGCKIYKTQESAIVAGKRYVRKMKKNGFQ